MAEQTIQLPASSYSESVSYVRWITEGNAFAINANLRDNPSNSRFLRIFQIGSIGQVVISIYNVASGGTFASGEDLSSLFETNGSVTITVGSRTLTVALGGADMRDVYLWTPANSDEVIAFYNAVFALPGNQAATLTLRDFVPVAPSFDDDTGDAISGNVGTAIANIVVPAANGNPAPAYAVHNNSLPAGLSFNANTRTISGNPTRRRPLARSRFVPRMLSGMRTGLSHIGLPIRRPRPPRLMTTPVTPLPSGAGTVIANIVVPRCEWEPRSDLRRPQ